VVSEILFEIPVRIHKYIINNLIREQAYNIINDFIDKVTNSAKQYPDIFIWVSKNLFSQSWDYDWLDYSKENLVLAYFRLMNELKKIETKGTRLKNMTIEVLFSNDMAVIKHIVDQSDMIFLSKLYDLFSSVYYVEESHLDKFFAIISEKYPDFSVSGQTSSEEEREADFEKLIVSQEGFDRKQSELNRMVKVEMVNLSKELSQASDVSGDLRENVEYNALMEKQSILKLAINKLDIEIKKAEILDFENVSTEEVNIGTNISFENIDAGQKSNYIILGPWDADYENKILSYRSPIAKALLGKRIGDEIDMQIGDDRKKIKIKSIEKYSQ